MKPLKRKLSLKTNNIANLNAKDMSHLKGGEDGTGNATDVFTNCAGTTCPGTLCWESEHPTGCIETQDPNICEPGTQFDTCGACTVDCGTLINTCGNSIQICC